MESLSIPILGPATDTPADDCYHGGAFFEAIGEDFASLKKRRDIIPADVLDAWFPPAPGVVETLRRHLEWVVRTSPPTQCAGLVKALARARGVPAESLVLGAGSSDLIFRAFGRWLTRDSRVLLLDPTYPEYAHVLEQVIGCAVDRLPLRREQGYRVDPVDLERALARGYDLAVLVNPNSPTGRHVPAGVLANVLARTAPRTRVWIDETYVEYAGEDQSLERLAAATERIVVCKSMSKMYALSGLRVAYLVTSPAAARALRRRTPPWAVSLAGQIAAVRALESGRYYRRRWTETHRLRESLRRGLESIPGLDVVEGVANFLLFHLAAGHPEAGEVVRRCRKEGLYLRDASGMGSGLGPRAIRIAVRDGLTNRRMLEILGRALSSEPAPRRRLPCRPVD